MSETQPANASIWLDIKRNIEFDIIRGNYTQSNKLPSISEVTKIYGCGKSTAQKVLDELCNEGISMKAKGVGYFVKPYSREQLIEKHTQQFDNLALDVIQEAYDMSMDKEDLERRLLAMVEKIYKM